MVDPARAAGIDVMIDPYPYKSSQTGFSVLIPPWALAAGDSALARRMRDPVLRDSILRGVIDYIVNDRGGGDIRRVRFGRVAWQPALEGKTLFDWATQRGVPTTPDGAAPLVVEGQLNGGATMIYHVIDEGDVRRIMQHPQTMIASDGRLTVPGEGAAHPRAYGTFPRVLGRYVREVGLLTLEEGVHKMTGMPAARLGLTGRGVIAEGASADLVGPALARRSVAVELFAPDGLAVRARPDELTQVLANLLQNAVRYTPRGGRVRVIADRDEDLARVRVANTGPGIPPEDLPRVWERFYRVEKSRDRARGGAGIGLAIVKQLVEAAGGRVDVASDGAWTEFTVLLPA